MKSKVHEARALTRLSVISLGLFLTLLAGCVSSGVDHREVSVPRMGPRKLAPTGYLVSREIQEASGIAKSDLYDDVYWVHNDSGDAPRVFPVTPSGENIGPTAGRGIAIKGAVNRDWEDIASDHDGNLLIGAFGNNANKRKDLSVYVVPEPNPFHDTEAQVSRRVPFHFPEQKAFPPEDRNFDVEALFVAAGDWYVLTKHRADTYTRLYRFDGYSETESNPLTLLGSFGARGMVTAADSLPSGERVAVLVYQTLWVFEPPETPFSQKKAQPPIKFGANGRPGASKVAIQPRYDLRRLFAGKIYWLPIHAGQCEGVCFIDKRTLLIVNEAPDPKGIFGGESRGRLFEVKVEDMQRVQ